MENVNAWVFKHEGKGIESSQFQFWKYLEKIINEIICKYMYDSEMMKSSQEQIESNLHARFLAQCSVFFIATDKGLCFVFVLEMVLVIQECFNYRLYRVKAFSAFHPTL